MPLQMYIAVISRYSQEITWSLSSFQIIQFNSDLEISVDRNWIEFLVFYQIKFTEKIVSIYNL